MNSLQSANPTLTNTRTWAKAGARTRSGYILLDVSSTSTHKPIIATNRNYRYLFIYAQYLRMSNECPVFQQEPRNVDYTHFMVAIASLNGHCPEHFFFLLHLFQPIGWWLWVIRLNDWWQDQWLGNDNDCSWVGGILTRSFYFVRFERWTFFSESNWNSTNWSMHGEYSQTTHSKQAIAKRKLIWSGNLLRWYRIIETLAQTDQTNSILF